MRNLRLKLSYNGSAYHGWQLQENADTVQGQVERSIERIFGSRHPVTGCSRTDAGVHANEYYCNFRTEKLLSPEDVARAVNAYLPEDIVVLGCEEVPLEFNSRFDTVSKEYKYRIWNSPLRNPFLVSTALHYKYHLDEKMLDEQAKDYIGSYEWDSFCASGSSAKTTLRTVKNASVYREGDNVCFTVEADGFLYNMVRIMTGTLIYINEGKIEKNTIRNIIEAKDRVRAGMTVPPEGLYLNKVFYEKRW